MKSKCGLYVKTSMIISLWIIWAGNAHADVKDTYPNISRAGSDTEKTTAWHQQCLKVENIKTPTRDIPSFQEMASTTLEYCSNAQDFYYDKLHQATTSKLEWKLVRQCAFAQDNYGVLMMLYANGFGVKKNQKLAIKYACNLDGSFKEMEGRIKHLTERAKNEKYNEPNENFDLCDDITSGYMQGECASIYSRQNHKILQKHISDFISTLPSDRKQSFEFLYKKLNDFSISRGYNETDVTGTARAALVIGAEDAEHDKFIEDIINIKKGEVPPFSFANLASLEENLNLSYQKIMDTKASELENPNRSAESKEEYLGFTTISKKDIQKGQLVWLQYREEFIKFYTPILSEENLIAWKALLTQRRVEQLSEFLE